LKVNVIGLVVQFPDPGLQEKHSPSTMGSCGMAVPSVRNAAVARFVTVVLLPQPKAVARR
jgi:hypothetical protein